MLRPTWPSSSHSTKSKIRILLFNVLSMRLSTVLTTGESMNQHVVYKLQFCVKIFFNTKNMLARCNLKRRIVKTLRCRANSSIKLSLILKIQLPRWDLSKYQWVLGMLACSSISTGKQRREVGCCIWVRCRLLRC